jgi:hypothetical protein
MSADVGFQCGHFAVELRQRAGVALGQLADAPGECLGYTVQREE